MGKAGRTKGERSRSSIIEVANRLFNEQGYHGTSMRQISQEAGIALGGIYNHFDGKEDIFINVLETYHPYHEITPILQKAEGATVEAFVQNAAEGMVTALDKRPNFLNLMFIEIVEFKSQHISQLLEIFYPQVISIVQLFADKQENLRSIPLPMIVRIFIGLFYSHYLFENLIGKEAPDDMQNGALQYSVDIFLHGILPREEG